MNFQKYQEQAQRTARQDMDREKRIAAAALGLTGEAGEVADHIKKYIGHGHALNVKEVSKELGDILWYVQEMAHLINVPLSLIALNNIHKLQKRYPQGFSEERSINRVE